MSNVSESHVNICEISRLNISTPEDLLRHCNDQLALRYLPVMIYMFLLIFTGFFGNIIVIIVFLRKTPRSSTHYFIINLAALDLLTVVIGMPTEIADLRYSLMFYAPMACKALRTVESLSTMGSIVTLMTVAIDRYNRICKYGKQMTNITAKRVCYMAWFIGAVTCWPAAIVFGSKTKDVGIPGVKAVDCSTDDSMRGTKYPLVYYGSLFLYFISCVVFFSVVYMKIILYIRKQKKKGNLSLKGSCKKRTKSEYNSNISEETSLSNSVKDKDPAQNSNGQQNDEVDSRHRNKLNTSNKTKHQIRTSKTTIMLGIVTVIFILSFLPFLVVMVIRNIIKNFEDLLNPSAEVFYKFCLKSYFLNNAINPVIYSFLNIQFRKDVKDLIGQLWRNNLCQNCNK